jgi:predicted aspartyl protease
VPIFNAESPNLALDGPLVEVTFGLLRSAQLALTSSDEPLPTPIRATALIDTGASGSVVKASLLQPLGLHPVGTVTVNTPTSHDVSCPTFAVQMTLPNGFVDVTVIEAPLDGQNIEALIGRDVLRHGLLIYQGITNQFTLSF